MHTADIFPRPQKALSLIYRSTQKKDLPPTITIFSLTRHHYLRHRPRSSSIVTIVASKPPEFIAGKCLSGVLYPAQVLYAGRGEYKNGTRSHRTKQHQIHVFAHIFGFNTRRLVNFCSTESERESLLGPSQVHVLDIQSRDAPICGCCARPKRLAATI